MATTTYKRFIVFSILDCHDKTLDVVSVVLVVNTKPYVLYLHQAVPTQAHTHHGINSKPQPCAHDHRLRINVCQRLDADVYRAVSEPAHDDAAVVLAHLADVRDTNVSNLAAVGVFAVDAKAFTHKRPCMNKITLATTRHNQVRAVIKSSGTLNLCHCRMLSQQK